MPPRVVLHKQNGHRHAPPTTEHSLGEVIRLVHSGAGDGPRPTFETLRFASAVRRETVLGLAEQVAHGVDSIRLGLADAMLRTHALFERGELADVRETLEACREQADAAARVVAKLVASMDLQASRREVLDVNELVTRVMGVVRHALPEATTVRGRLDPGLPRIVGDAGELERALGTLLTHAALADGEHGPPASVVVETSHREGILRGEAIVRVRIERTAAGEAWAARVARYAAEPRAAVPDEDLDLFLACRAVSEHGGLLSTRSRADMAGVTIDLPAA